jgi:hypothetical protein
MKRLEMRKGDLCTQDLTCGSAKRARTVERPLHRPGAGQTALPCRAKSSSNRRVAVITSYRPWRVWVVFEVDEVGQIGFSITWRRRTLLGLEGWPDEASARAVLVKPRAQLVWRGKGGMDSDCMLIILQARIPSSN